MVPTEVGRSQWIVYVSFRKESRGLYPVTPLGTLRQSADIVSMTGNSAEIETGHLPNIILELFRFSSVQSDYMHGS
jgi:hypothetical protein